jgi:SAM-dependent methyltransferase
MRELRAWAALSLALGGALALAARAIAARGRVPLYEQPALGIASLEGALLAAAGALVALLAWRGPRWLGEPPETAQRVVLRPYLTLFLVSFIALFVELMLIRYTSSQVRIFAFYKNVPLIGCYLGLGLGCFLARGDARHARSFLLWTIPVAVALSAGSLLASNALGKLAAIGTSEHMLGDYVPQAADRARELASQLLMAGFCVATLVVITLLFALLGRLLGEAFERVPRLPAYTANIAGSLAGILGFLGFSLLETPPPVWFAVGLVPLAWWAARPRDAALLLGLAAAACLAVLPSYGDTVWSRYQKLVGHEVAVGGGASGYLVEISDVFYQVAVDRRPERLAAGARDPFPHYGLLYRQVPRPGRVLVVGAGTGNDVAAALQAGASRVDAVDIDPAIVRMGRLHHPERPYDDPRVRVVVDDARHAFRVLPAASYDLVVFGLLDSHTQLGVSSVRLDNYVFTLESLGEARRLLAPGGRIAVTAAVFEPWFGRRLETMLAAATGGGVDVTRNGYWTTFLGSPEAGSPAAAAPPGAPLPSDDWPFLYLPERAVPAAYLWVVGAMALASLVVLRLAGLPFARFDSYHGHLFFLGAAFLLMEVHAINRLALLFGTTWLVSAVTIALVLTLILAANVTAMAFARVPYALAYGGLAVSLAASYFADPADVVGRGGGAALALAVLLLSPVYFAGLVFARSFRRASLAGPAIGANILGAVLGGWIEYATMALGVRALVVLAALFYALSLALLARATRGTRASAAAPAPPA